MRLRNIPTARAELAASSYVIQEPDMAAHRGKWAEAFAELRSRASAAAEHADTDAGQAGGCEGLTEGNEPAARTAGSQRRT